MSGSYEVWLTNDKGARLLSLNPLEVSISLTMVVNGIGELEIVTPASQVPETLLAKDRLVQVWRNGDLLDCYFIRQWKYWDTGKADMLSLKGVGPNHLLTRRVVAHYAGSANADRTAPADDMLKHIVTDAIANGTNPTPTYGTRVWSQFSVEGFTSLAPTITKGFSWRQLLTKAGSGLFADIALASLTAGTRLYFQVLPVVTSGSTISFIFKTFVGYLGTDRRADYIFSKATGTLFQPAVEYIAPAEVNYTYGCGPGEGEARDIRQAWDETRVNQSIWNRCEGVADARNSDGAAILDAANTLLAAGRPSRKFTAVITDTPTTQYGRLWSFGDYIKAEYLGQTYDAIVAAVAVKLQAGAEDISAKLECTTSVN